MDEEIYSLNIETCIADRSIPSVIREVFLSLRENGYVNVGSFFKNLSDIDLETLSTLADFTHPDVEDATQEQVDMGYQYMSLLGMALMVGEGFDLSMDNCELGLKLAISYTAIESLHRHGMVNVFYENWSMDSDTNKPIVELKK